MKYKKPKPKRDPLRRRAIRRKPGVKPQEYIKPSKKGKGGPYTQSKDYQYFWGHITRDVAKQLPAKRVICWINYQNLSLPMCAMKKFWNGQKECKRCSLFQGDEHAQELKDLIEIWEKDDLENLEE